jgi:threonine dehydrogenase-like Zn-dependent dehydrogenase
VAVQLGAERVFDPTQTSLEEEIVRRTGFGVDVAFECAGARSTFHEAIQATRGAGQVIIVSLSWEPVHCLRDCARGGIKAIYGTGERVVITCCSTTEGRWPDLESNPLNDIGGLSGGPTPTARQSSFER